MIEAWITRQYMLKRSSGEDFRHPGGTRLPGSFSSYLTQIAAVPDQLHLFFCPCISNRNFYFNRNFTEKSFACLNHGLLEDWSCIICHPFRNFEDDFVMHRSDNLSSGIRQFLGEYAQSLFCDVCGCTLDGRAVKCVLKLKKPVSLACTCIFDCEIALFCEP